MLVTYEAGEDLDDLAVGRVLSRIVEREAPDLVLCAAASGGDGNEAAGVALAAFLGLPRVTAVRTIDNDSERGVATVERALPSGQVERLEVPTPALITIAAAAYRPRYATLSGIQLACRKPFETMTIEDTGVDPMSLDAARGARLRSLARPPRPAGAEMIEGSPEEIAGRIADIIKGRVG